MGSFNTTCFASHQTIATYDKCRVMLVTQSATYQAAELTVDGEALSLHGIANTTCYADCFWLPVTAFLPAKYADYGRFELQFDPLTRSRVLALLAQVLQACPSVAPGENASHDLAFDFDVFLKTKAPSIDALLRPVNKDERPAHLGDTLDSEMQTCWDYLAERMHEHRLFYRSGNGNVRPLQLAVLHEETYLALVGDYAASTGWDNEPFEQTAYLTRLLAKARADALKFAADADPAEKADFWLSFCLSEAVRDGFRGAAGNTRYPAHMESGLIHTLTRKLAAGTLSDADFITKVTPILNDHYALGGLTHMNLHLEPMVYAGQDYDNQAGRAYAKFVARVSLSVTRARKVSLYGEPRAYGVRVTDLATGAALEAFGPETDTYFEVQALTPAPETPGHYDLRFTTSLEFDDAKEALGYFLEDQGPCVLLDTLVQQPKT